MLLRWGSFPSGQARTGKIDCPTTVGEKVAKASSSKDQKTKKLERHCRDTRKPSKASCKRPRAASTEARRSNIQESQQRKSRKLSTTSSSSRLDGEDPADQSDKEFSLVGPATETSVQHFLRHTSESDKRNCPRCRPL